MDSRCPIWIWIQSSNTTKFTSAEIQNFNLSYYNEERHLQTPVWELGLYFKNLPPSKFEEIRTGILIWVNFSRQNPVHAVWFSVRVYSVFLSLRLCIICLQNSAFLLGLNPWMFLIFCIPVKGYSDCDSNGWTDSFMSSSLCCHLSHSVVHNYSLVHYVYSLQTLTQPEK